MNYSGVDGTTKYESGNEFFTNLGFNSATHYQFAHFIWMDVTSTWFNSLVYDAALKESEKKTWVINGPDSEIELIPYGLMGPVFIK